ncbi:MAG: hypothetical protein WKF75_07885 [Singulisphaera sp.]
MGRLDPRVRAPRRDAGGCGGANARAIRRRDRLHPWERAGRERDSTVDGRPSEGQKGWLGTLPADWHAWVLIGWGLAIVGQVAAIAYQRERLRRLLHQAEPAIDPALLALVAELSGGSGCGGGRWSRQSAAAAHPSSAACTARLWCYHGALRRARPRAPAIRPGPRADPHQRGDLLWDWIPAVARVFYFFHPAAHYIASAPAWAELACDQAAMVLTGQGRQLRLDLGRGGESVVGPPALRAALVSARLDGAEPCPASATAIVISPSQ